MTAEEAVAIMRCRLPEWTRDRLEEAFLATLSSLVTQWNSAALVYEAAAAMQGTGRAAVQAYSGQALMVTRAQNLHASGRKREAREILAALAAAPRAQAEWPDLPCLPSEGNPARFLETLK